MRYHIGFQYIYAINNLLTKIYMYLGKMPHEEDVFFLQITH